MSKLRGNGNSEEDFCLTETFFYNDSEDMTAFVNIMRDGVADRVERFHDRVEVTYRPDW